jgi:hypothetical protein
LSALLPCPFCGGSAKHGEWATHYVKCTDCGVQVIGLTQAEAVADWNTRAPVADTSGTNDRTRDGPPSPMGEAILSNIRPEIREEVAYAIELAEGATPQSAASTDGSGA